MLKTIVFLLKPLLWGIRKLHLHAYFKINSYLMISEMQNKSVLLSAPLDLDFIDHSFSSQHHQHISAVTLSKIVLLLTQRKVREKWWNHSERPPNGSLIILKYKKYILLNVNFAKHIFISPTRLGPLYFQSKRWKLINVEEKGPAQREILKMKYAYIWSN